MDRVQQITHWLSAIMPGQDFSLTPASADASFRRYFRATFADGSSKIVMDAPPQHEDCRPFIAVDRLFEAAGVHVPHIYAENLEQGFLLLSDLGDRTYLNELTDAAAQALYLDAIDALIAIQSASKPGVLPAYDKALLKRECDLFPDWYIDRYKALVLSDAEKAILQGTIAMVIERNLHEGQVFVHRDYHSRNLMRVTEANPGVIDFQDAVYGPISYDLVSLFKYADIEWDEERVLDWVIRYWEKARKAGLPVPAAFDAFYQDFEWMGVQRHIKVLGIFARLAIRDQKTGYLKDMPLVMRYLRKACDRYSELRPLLSILDKLENVQVQSGYTF